MRVSFLLRFSSSSSSGFFPRVSPLLGIVLVAASQLQLAAGQFQGCDYFQNLTVGQRFDVFSPGYPQMYRGRVDCRWTAVSPARSTIIIQCLDMNLPTVCCCERVNAKSLFLCLRAKAPCIIVKSLRIVIKLFLF